MNKNGKNNNKNVKWEINNNVNVATKYRFLPDASIFSAPYKTSGTKTSKSIVINSFKLVKYQPLKIKSKLEMVVVWSENHFVSFIYKYKAPAAKHVFKNCNGKYKNDKLLVENNIVIKKNGLYIE